MSKKWVAGSALAVAGLALSACGGGGPGGSSGDISGGKVVLGVINDASGVYKDVSGPNGVKAVEMAVADYKKKYGDDAVAKKIEVVSADHQNKPDVANTKAQELYDRKQADVIIDVPTSSAALAIAGVAKSKKKVFIDVGAGTTELTGDQCNKYTFHWAYDTWMLANGTARTLTDAGAKKWSLVYPDYAFGQDMDKSFTEAVEASGGTVTDHIATPFPNDNFSTFLTKAASSKPDIVGAMHAGGDLVNLVKQYNDSGLRDQGIGLSTGLLFLSDIHSLGVEGFQGVQFTDAWYWDLDEKSREWADRFLDETGVRPTYNQAGDYSAATQYLEAVQKAGTDTSDDIVKELEGKKVDDMFLRNGEIRAEDHSVIHDVYLAKVKAPEESKDEWDVETIVKTIPADEAFKPASESGCSM